MSNLSPSWGKLQRFNFFKSDQVLDMICIMVALSEQPKPKERFDADILSRATIDASQELSGFPGSGKPEITSSGCL